MSKYMLLMKGDDSQGASPEDMQGRMQAYMGWMQKMMADDRLVAGEPLEPSGALLANKDSVVTDGPFLESKEIIGGYVIINASDLDDAVEIARGCPLLDHCEIFVRPVLQVPDMG